MNPPTFPQRCRHLGEIQVQLTRISPKGTQLPQEKERSGSPLLSRALADKKKGISEQEEMSTDFLTNPTTAETTPNPHTRSKIIPL